jgi:hypothetical protein
MPIAAHSQIAAAVVSPCTAPRRVMIRPAPEEPDARDDLGSDTRRVEHDGADRQPVTESVLADENDQRSRRPDDRLCAQARALALNLTLEPDKCGEQEGRRAVR